MKNFMIILFIILFSQSLVYGQLPPSYDWRNIEGTNYITPIKNQGNCNACFAFATVAALESQIIKTYGISFLKDMSEQTVISCGSSGTCTSGGDKVKASSYLYNTGIPLESCFPYTGTDVSCGNACANWVDHQMCKFTGYTVRNSPTIAQIKSDIYTYGPIVADMRLLADFRNQYNNWPNKIYTACFAGEGTCNDTGEGHDVLVIGYNDEGEYFICKNSWGREWGDNGYFKIAYSEVKSMGGRSQFATQTIYYHGADCGKKYYVDYLNGSDSNSGTSPSSPLKHCPGDNRYTPSGDAPRALYPGDIIIFKGGVTYLATNGDSSIININWSGVGDDSLQRIIYDGDSGTYAPRWAIGKDKAIIDGNDIATSHFYFSGPRKYITINNFVMKKGRKYPFSNPNQGGQLVRNETIGSDYVTISNCDMSEAGVIEVPEPCVDNPKEICGRASGICIKNLNGKYWKVHNNTFTDCGWKGFSVTNGSNIEFYNNILSGRIGWMAEFTTGDADVGELSDFSIYGNVFRDHMFSDKCTNPPACYPTAETHGNWLYIYGANCRRASLSNVRIYNNIFYHSIPITQRTGFSSGFIHYAANTNLLFNGLYVFNNVFFNPENCIATIGTRVYENCPDAGYLTNVYILNNTIFNDISSTSSFRVNKYGITPNNFTNLYIKNNNIYTSQFAIQVPYRTTIGDTVDINYNNYYAPWSTNNFYELDAINNKSYFRSWFYWRGTLGYDIDGSGPISDPLFIDTTIGHNFNLRLSSTLSPAYKKGANLSNLCSSNPNLNMLCYDKDGNPRPSSGAWSIGAYEFIQDQKVPNPPRELRIIP